MRSGTDLEASPDSSQQMSSLSEELKSRTKHLLKPFQSLECLLLLPSLMVFLEWDTPILLLTRLSHYLNHPIILFQDFFNLNPIPLYSFLQFPATRLELCGRLSSVSSPFHLPKKSEREKKLTCIMVSTDTSVTIVLYLVDMRTRKEHILFSQYTGR